MTDHRPPPAVEAIGRLEADLRLFDGASGVSFCQATAASVGSDIRSLIAELAEAKESLRHSVEREAGLREALVQADLTIRSFPGADQSHVEFIRAALDRRAGT